MTYKDGSALPALGEVEGLLHGRGDSGRVREVMLETVVRNHQLRTIRCVFDGHAPRSKTLGL